jgi:tetratricopeptide (TPR) repeat protein
MKKLKSTPSVFLLIFMIFTASYAQTPMKISHSCNFAAAETEGQLYTYEASREAEDIIKEIMDAYSLPQNFIVKSADCKNALATSEGKQRYILYSTAFLEDFKSKAETKWAAYCVLAHEIGHHLSNHDLETTDPLVRRVQELEADRFAGNVLQKLGANLVQAQSGINTFALTGESTTHPKKQARLEAVSVGWKKAEEQKSRGEGDAAAINSDEVKLLKKAIETAKNDTLKAIELLDQAIDINPRFVEGFIRRAEYRYNADDTEGAKTDLEEAIRLNKNAYEAYAMRGYILGAIQNQYEAGLKDINLSIRINKEFADAYFYRAMVYQASNLADVDKKIVPDFNKAIELNPKHYEAFMSRGRYLRDNGEVEKSISDFTKAIALNNAIEGYEARSTANFWAKKYAETLADFDQIEKVTGKIYPVDYATCLHGLGKTREAVAYLDKYIAKAPLEDAYKMPTYFEPYMYRGIYKALLKQESAAEKDFQAALKTKDKAWGADYQKIGCLLVDFNLAKLAVPYLQKAVEMQGDSSPNSKACLEAALKKIKQ